MKTKITKEQWLKEVEQEIQSLKKAATKKELSKLDIGSFNNNNYRSCIYGLMTGDCRSKRASKLIKKCCVRFTDNKKWENDDDADYDMESSMKVVNGKTTRECRSVKKDSIRHLSSLEHYILLYEANNENVIKYLKGETKKLEL